MVFTVRLTVRVNFTWVSAVLPSVFSNICFIMKELVATVVGYQACTSKVST